MSAVDVTNAAIPFADLYKQYLSIKPEMDRAIAGVIAESSFIRGPHVERFESAFAAAIGTAHCVSTANGTDSLYIAMHALALKPGDEVIVPAMSWISTSETVTQAGGRVVFCDVDPQTHVIDPERLREAITSRTVGIIPVHLYGHPADMDAIMATAARHNLWVIEDCAQAHLATVGGRTVGTMGNAGSFSFYPGKNLGAMGDAGAVVTSDRDLADRMAMFARHGGLKKGDHQIEGINSRLDGLQAAILNVKLPHLAGWTARRREIAAIYNERLSGVTGLQLPVEASGCEHVYHLYVVLTPRRDALMAYLKEAGIQTVINYPRALPYLPCYAHMGHLPDHFPVAHAMQGQVLSLPIFPEMTDDEVARVADHVVEFFA